MREGREEEAGNERGEGGERGGRREGEGGKREVFILPAKPHSHCLQWCLGCV